MMYVANYIPEPEVMVGNVSLERYALRLKFIRQVYAEFLASVGATAFFSLLLSNAVTTLWLPIGVLIATLIGASVVRSLGRQKAWEVKVARPILLLVIMVTAYASQAINHLNIPVWSILAGLGCFGVYAWLCGRDFSFVAGYVLALIASSTILSFVMVSEKMTTQASTQALLWNGLGLLYVVYDLASLMSRRKLGEETLSCLDLFRDMFNVVGWLPRVALHWHRHRILNDLSFDIPFRRAEE